MFQLIALLGGTAVTREYPSNSAMSAPLPGFNR